MAFEDLGQNLERVKKFLHVKVCLSSQYLFCDPRFGSSSDESQNTLIIPAYVKSKREDFLKQYIIGKLIEPGLENKNE